MLKLLSTATAAALLAMASVSFAQSTPSGTSAGAATSRCDLLIGAEKERCLREEGSASTGGSASGSVMLPSTGVPSVGGLSKCENMLGAEKEKCLQAERGGTGSTGGRPAGAGGSHAPGSTGTGAGTMGPQNTAPSGSVR